MSSSQTSAYIDIEALSGILGSISIACWIVVFTPQIIENTLRSSASGLSLTFLIIWLLGDIFNILGAVLQGVLPTMTVLAVYYTVADMALLGQCLYYRGCFGWVGKEEKAGEEEPLLWRERETAKDVDGRNPEYNSASSISAKDITSTTHLSPTIPLLPSPQTPAKNPASQSSSSSSSSSTMRSILFNTSILLSVCSLGILGWYLTPHQPNPTHPSHTPQIHFSTWGQTFGYLCAILYLGSRIPQILLNHQRKSTEGVSVLFFLFACVGNATFVMSILAYEPLCASGGGEEGGRGGCGEGEWRRGYARYVLANASWIVGSAGTLVLDLAIFGQFWLYRGRKGVVRDF